MTRLWNIAPALFALCLASGCASSLKNAPQTESVSAGNQDATFKAMLEQIDRNTAAIRSEQTESAAIQQRLKDIEARIDSSLSMERSSIEEMRENITFLTNQVQRLDGSIQEPKQAEQKPAAPKEAAPFKPGGFDVEASYTEALSLFKARRYEDAINAFTEVMTMAPKNSLADNAQYWIGECYYGLRNYEKSLQAFNKVLTFQNTNKAPDSHLKIALIYQLMNNVPGARDELNLVIKDYPTSDAAKIATSKLESIGK
jgi:tol-pal system protein YbgF